MSRPHDALSFLQPARAGVELKWRDGGVMGEPFPRRDWRGARRGCLAAGTKALSFSQNKQSKKAECVNPSFEGKRVATIQPECTAASACGIPLL